MSGKRSRSEEGFTILETAAVVLILGAVIGFATPKIVSAMRQYRLNIAMHQAADLIHRVKTQAVSDNHKASLLVDTTNRRFGIVIYDTSGTVVRTDYLPMPNGINFATPTGVSAPVSGAPTSQSVSFPAQEGSSTVFQQDFNSRGFPVVAAGAINALYLTNGDSYGAVTVNSVSGTRIFRWEASQWVDLRH
jgi:Tfp pilus assembly protein FimT